MIKKILAISAVLVLIFAGAFLVYAGDFYHAEDGVFDAVAATADVRIIDDGYAVVPAEYDCGLVFYPGAKVEAEAYLPLMKACADRGILSVVVKMPYNLAFLKTDAADSVYDLFGDVQDWYIAGHSMGGAAAAVYLEKHPRAKGLILLAAFSTPDLTDNGIRVLSVCGSEDGILNAEHYNKYRKNLPQDCTEFVIPGGNHAGFGKYGAQKGDGEAMISSDEQIEITAERIRSFITA